MNCPRRKLGMKKQLIDSDRFHTYKGSSISAVRRSKKARYVTKPSSNNVQPDPCHDLHGLNKNLQRTPVLSPRVSNIQEEVNPRGTYRME